jgi:hypothetical protein
LITIGGKRCSRNSKRGKQCHPLESILSFHCYDLPSG